jgi:hypothetical protein
MVWNHCLPYIHLSSMLQATMQELAVGYFCVSFIGLGHQDSWHIILIITAIIQLSKLMPSLCFYLN